MIYVFFWIVNALVFGFFGRGTRVGFWSPFIFSLLFPLWGILPFLREGVKK